jgi:hypothetical protein
MEPGLWPLPAAAHRTFTRVVDLGDTLDGFGFESVCRGCDWVSHPIRSSYDGAFEDGYRHRQAVADWAAVPTMPSDIGPMPRYDHLSPMADG